MEYKNTENNINVEENNNKHTKIRMFGDFSFSLEEFIYNYLITLSNYIIPKKGV
jgi:hypothetical protein